MLHQAEAIPQIATFADSSYWLIFQLVIETLRLLFQLAIDKNA